MKDIKRRVLKLEKKRGKGGMKSRFLTLYDGESAPEIKGVDVVIMQLPGLRPANS